MLLQPTRRKAGFTLVELLVVIGIIALLISILLPALGKARKAANTVKCLSNLRSIVQSMQIYSAQNRGAIPGSPFTTAQFVYQPGGQAAELMAPGYTVVSNSKNYPTVNQTFDWMTPIARVMGTKFTDDEEAANDTARVARWNKVSAMPVFQCPENGFFATPFSSGTQPAGLSATLMVSYCVAGGFLIENNPKNPLTATSAYEVGTKFANPPAGYSPSTSKIGSASKKIFVADGGKFTNGSATGAPTVSLNFGASVSGATAVDDGAWSLFSNSWDRGEAPGNTPASAGGHAPAVRDARTYAYRHGANRQYGAADSFRMNAAFFDGHAETLGDLESSNPVYWYPKGSMMDITDECGADVKKFYFNNVTSTTYILPQ